MVPYATIGRKLGHSYSKLIHNAFNKYDFDLIEVEPEKARDFMLTAPFKGITITIPYKQLALEVSDVASPEAQRIGCANTLVRRDDGKLYAYNTDYAGFAFMAQQAGVSFQNAKVLILGSGGTSLTTRTVAADLGAREVVIVSRSGPVNYDNVVQLHADADVIINATPVGMYPETNAAPLDLTPFKNLKGLLDVVYNPMRTRLKLQAMQRNIPCGDGLKMLVAQAKFCMDHFLLTEHDNAIVTEVTGMIRRQTANVVLVGMPGCGKTTIAQAVAEKLERQVVDIDAEIVARANMPIKDIFATQGEQAFRDLESQVIADIAKQSNLVIATGGGAIIRQENRLNLASNGFIYHIDRNLDALQLNAGRPLSTDLEAVQKLYQQRAPLYEAARDACIDNNHSIQDAVNELLGAFHEDSCR